MGLFKLFKRNLTPEELEEKSRKEKEWAQKCYRSGEKFAEKIQLDKKVERVNRFANRYPKTFFSLIVGALVASFVVNLLFSLGGMDLGGQAAKGIEAGQMPAAPQRNVLQLELDSLYREMRDLGDEFDRIIEKEEKTEQDTLRMYQIYQRMQAVEELIVGKENGGDKDAISQRIEELLTKERLTAEDSVEIEELLMQYNNNKGKEEP